MADYKQLVKTDNFIGGHWEKGTSSVALKVTQKFTGEFMAEIQLASPGQMEKSIVTAMASFEEMKKMSSEKKAEALWQLVERFKFRQEEFAQLICAEAGKPISYARGEAARCLTTLELAAQAALRLKGEVVNVDYGAGQGKQAYTRRFPLGPIACISPFNFPLNLALHKIGPALAAGCSVVLKPSPFAPLSVLAFADLMKDSGFPEGTLSVLNCANEVSEIMVRDERLKMLSFTGSPQVGWYLKSICGRKKVALELGGNAGVYVDEDQDLGSVAKTVAMGAFLYSGQICISTQRVVVHVSVFETFKQLLIEETEKLKVGNPEQADTIVGPMIDKIHLERIASWVEEARAAGAEILTGGKIVDAARLLYAPTILTKTKLAMKVVCEEAFGPIVTLESVKNFAEGLDQLNSTKFGLQAGIYTHRIDRMKEAHEKLEVGGVIINGIPGFRVDGMPYGGVKESGFGREGINYAIEEMTEPRLLVY